MSHPQTPFSLAEAFMKASGFYGEGKEGSLGQKVIQAMNKSEKEEYGLDLPRGDMAWAEFFSKAAIRQGRLNDAAALVPVDMTDKNTVANLAQFNPQFAIVVSTAQRNKL